jgi:hypothetical protein
VPMMACAKEADNSICAAPKTLFRHTYPTGELIPQSAVARANGPPHPIHRKGGVQTQTRSATSVGRKLLVQDHSGSLIIMKLATSAVESTGCGDWFVVHGPWELLLSVQALVIGCVDHGLSQHQLFLHLCLFHSIPQSFSQL